MKILLLGSQHGNELLGDMLYEYIQTHHHDLLATISFIIGNPRAHKQNKRYTESDMNRSYASTVDSYESRQARRVLSYIKKHNFDLVLDLHTTVCVQPPCFIIESVNDSNRAFLRSSSIDKIVMMRHDIVRTSLIGTARQVVSIEVSNNDINADLLESLCLDLKRFVTQTHHNIERYEYVVESLIAKNTISNVDAARLRNFEMSAGNFIPILVGENSYKKNTPYLGFKASKETIIRL